MFILFSILTRINIAFQLSIERKKETENTLHKYEHKNAKHTYYNKHIPIIPKSSHTYGYSHTFHPNKTKQNGNDKLRDNKIR